MNNNGTVALTQEQLAMLQQLSPAQLQQVAAAQQQQLAVAQAATEKRIPWKSIVIHGVMIVAAVAAGYGIAKLVDYWRSDDELPEFGAGGTGNVSGTDIAAYGSTSGGVYC